MRSEDLPKRLRQKSRSFLKAFQNSQKLLTARARTLSRARPLRHVSFRSQTKTENTSSNLQVVAGTYPVAALASTSESVN